MGSEPSAQISNFSGPAPEPAPLRVNCLVAKQGEERREGRRGLKMEAEAHLVACADLAGTLVRPCATLRASARCWVQICANKHFFFLFFANSDVLGNAFGVVCSS